MTSGHTHYNQGWSIVDATFISSSNVFGHTLEQGIPLSVTMLKAIVLVNCVCMAFCIRVYVFTPVTWIHTRPISWTNRRYLYLDGFVSFNHMRSYGDTTDKFIIFIFVSSMYNNKTTIIIAYWNNTSTCTLPLTLELQETFILAQFIKDHIVIHIQMIKKRKFNITTSEIIHSKVHLRSSC